MKRIDLYYGGHIFSLGGREFADVQREIDSFHDEGGWLLVNDGEGARRDAYLWLTRGCSIALVPIPEEPIDHQG